MDWNRGNDATRSDGSIESVVSFSTVLAISFVTATVFATNESTHFASHIIVWVTIVIFMFAGFVSIIILTVLVYRNRSYWITTTNLVNDPSVKLKLIFLWIFGLGMAIQTTLVVIANITCLGVGELQENIYMGLSMLTSLVMIAYLFYQMSFISYLKHSRFISSVIIHFCFMLIILSNVLIWFTSVVRTINSKNSSNNTRPTTLDDVCYKTSAVATLSKSLTSYMIPFRLEFFLHATVFLLNLWLTVNDRDHSFSVEIFNSSRRINRNRPASNEYTCVYISAIIFAIWTNLPVIIVTAVYVFIYKGSNYGLFVVLQVCDSAQCVILLVLLLLLYYLVPEECNFQSEQRRLNSTEYILILSFTGAVSYITVKLASVFYEKAEISNVRVVKYVVCLLLEYLQLVFVIHAKRYERVPNKKYRMLLFILIVMCISNISIWFNGTFIGLYDRVNTGGHEVLFSFGTWRIFQHILYPMLLYFHFQTAMEFYVLYVNFKNG